MISISIKKNIVHEIIIIFYILFAMIGCSTSMKEKYYLMAHDPETKTTNYFRIMINGRADLSKAKFSTGFYDKSAVERLFSETAISQEYLAAKAKDELGGQFETTLEKLKAIEVGTAELEAKLIMEAKTSISELIDSIDKEFNKNKDLKEKYGSKLESARSLLNEGKKALEEKQDFMTARVKFREALNEIETILTILEGEEDLDYALKTTLAKLTGIGRVEANRLTEVNATISELINHYRTRLTATKKLQNKFDRALKRAERLRNEGERALKTSDLITAKAKLRGALSTILAIRLTLESKVIVRFFDGAGNEIDVTSKTMVIFVSTDASPFTNAIRSLVESEEAKRDILRIVLGPKAQEAEYIEKRLSVSNQEIGALSLLLENYKKEIESINIESGDKKDEMQKIILNAATSVGGAITPFENSKEIESYLRGMEAR